MWNSIFKLFDLRWSKDQDSQENLENLKEWILAGSCVEFGRRWTKMLALARLLTRRRTKTSVALKFNDTSTQWNEIKSSKVHTIAYHSIDWHVSDIKQPNRMLAEENRHRKFPEEQHAIFSAPILLSPLAYTYKRKKGKKNRDREKKGRRKRDKT